jgi:hypothetical protein
LRYSRPHAHLARSMIMKDLVLVASGTKSFVIIEIRSEITRLP